MESPPDYPELYTVTDACSVDKQKNYFRLFKAKIVLLIAIAATASVSGNKITGLQSLGIIAATILLVLMVLTVIMDLKKYDRIWFSSRAIAETVKKESWFFMMKVKPYDTKETAAVNTFLDQLGKVFDSQSPVFCELSKHIQGSAQITEKMKSIRNWKVKERLDYYIVNRIHDQREWYAKKSTFNKTQENRWFVLSWVFQFLAVLLAFYIFVFENPLVNPIGVLTTTATAVISWMSVRSYRELSQSYGLTTQELSILEDRAQTLLSEDDLREIVEEVERAISREHTIWLARRVIP